MSLVSSYPQAYHHPGALAAHDLYAFHPGSRYSDPPHPHPGAASLHDGPYFQNWVFNTQADMNLSHESYGLGGAAPSSEYTTMGMFSMLPDQGPPVRLRCVKRRVTAKRKERRRTQNINSAFSNLRGCIPNVPSDTKLSKIKTLRLATSYISYLMNILEKDDPSLTSTEFKAELTKKVESREDRKRREEEEIAAKNGSDKKNKCRTGWPQHVWASELPKHHDQEDLLTDED